MPFYDDVSVEILNCVAGFISGNFTQLQALEVGEFVIKSLCKKPLAEKDIPVVGWFFLVFKIFSYFIISKYNKGDVAGHHKTS